MALRAMRKRWLNKYKPNKDKDDDIPSSMPVALPDEGPVQDDDRLSLADEFQTDFEDPGDSCKKRLFGEDVDAFFECSEPFSAMSQMEPLDETDAGVTFVDSGASSESAGGPLAHVGKSAPDTVI